MESLKCNTCNEPLSFILSIPAPTDPAAMLGAEEGEEATPIQSNRFFYIFACPGGKCALSTSSAAVVRVQLRDGATPAGGGAEEGGQTDARLYLKETEIAFEITSEEQECLDEEEHVQQMISRYNQEQKVEEAEAKSSGGGGGDDADAMVDDTEVDTETVRLQTATAAHPSQALRYYAVTYHEEDIVKVKGQDRDGCPLDKFEEIPAKTFVKPLWACRRGIPSAAPPPCPLCKSERRVELQVLPQALNFVQICDKMHGKKHKQNKALQQLLLDLDWGTLVVYSCSKSCDIAPVEGRAAGYAAEFIYRQPGVDSHLEGNLQSLLAACGPASRKC